MTDTDRRRVNKGNKRSARKFVKPSLDDVCAYCRQRKNNVSADQFIDHYDANGWVQGKGKPIRDWKAAVRTWERNGIRRQSPAAAVAIKFDERDAL